MSSLKANGAHLFPRLPRCATWFPQPQVLASEWGTVSGGYKWEGTEAGAWKAKGWAGQRVGDLGDGEPRGRLRSAPRSAPAGRPPPASTRCCGPKSSGGEDPRGPLQPRLLGPGMSGRGSPFPRRAWAQLASSSPRAGGWAGEMDREAAATEGSGEGTVRPVHSVIPEGEGSRTSPHPGRGSWAPRRTRGEVGAGGLVSDPTFRLGGQSSLWAPTAGTGSCGGLSSHPPPGADPGSKPGVDRSLDP